jgi:hypothetical protein
MDGDGFQESSFQAAGFGFPRFSGGPLFSFSERPERAPFSFSHQEGDDFFPLHLFRDPYWLVFHRAIRTEHGKR